MGENSDQWVLDRRLERLERLRKKYEANPCDATALDVWAAENDVERQRIRMSAPPIPDEPERAPNDFSVRECIDLTLGALD